MHATKACGIRTASVSLHSYARSVLAVQRFDRRAEKETRETVVSRLHQEDLGQAFGLLPSEKYLELPDGSLHRIAELIRTISSRPLDDLRLLRQTICYDYLIGSRDNHLKNLSFV